MRDVCLRGYFWEMPITPGQDPNEAYDVIPMAADPRESRGGYRPKHQMAFNAA
jgi:hypothetical protein